MSLENFRKIDIVWHKATRRIFHSVRVASSDDRGRKLVVQVLNDNVVKELSDVELRLYWEHPSGTKGFNDFEAVDASRGIYEIYFSRGMLENVGTHKAWLHLTDTTGSVTSETFGVEVFSGIDLEAVESTDEFSALNSALARVVAIENQEEERQANESSRQQAENQREQAESERETAESTRESNENARQSQEATRENAEDTRLSNENTRKSSETERLNAETNRQEIFEANESNRQSTFEQNESTRESNEQTRQIQEASRESNETNRQSEFENMKGQVDDLEETYAPRLSEIEKRYIWFGEVIEID
jgi:hypothetical protein